VNGGRLVFCWAIHGVQDQGCRTGINELVLRTGWYYDQVSGLNFLVFACDCSEALPGGECEDLVDSVFLQRTVST